MWRPEQDRFTDRADAGRRLTTALEHLRGSDAVVLGLPRGGVPVASEIARALGLPLDVIVVRKLGLPWHPETAMGAIGEDDCEVLDRAVVAAAGVAQEQLRAVERRERIELRGRLRRLRGAREPVDLTGRTALVVDDGVATGATARVAVRVARLRGASHVVVAVPVAPAEAAHELSEADDVVVLLTPSSFTAVSLWYRRFPEVTDAEVLALLAASSGDG